MDRWEDADDDISGRGRQKPLGRVAAHGLAGFVSSTTIGTANAQSFGKIEVVKSKREQRKDDDARRMPPPVQPPPPAAAPPLVQSLPGGSGPPKCPVPSWAGAPPPGSRLLVYKDGTVIQEILLEKEVTLFGRVEPLVDVVLDHPSISRQHALMAYDAARCAWRVVDLGSTHGTFVEDRQLAKNDPTDLQPGVELRFAASTRRYKLAPPAASKRREGEQQQQQAEGVAGEGPDPSGSGRLAEAGAMPPPPPKRPRVSFADEANQGKPGPSGQLPLETVIGFSDGRDFVARVGPKAADEAAQGQFAAAVATTVIVSPRGSEVGMGALLRRRSSEGGSGGEEGAAAAAAAAAPSPREAAPAAEARPGPGGAGGSGAGGGAGGGGAGPGAGAGRLDVKPQLREFVERIRKEPARAGSGGLYEFLPPPAK